MVLDNGWFSQKHTESPTDVSFLRHLGPCIYHARSCSSGFITGEPRANHPKEHRRFFASRVIVLQSGLPQARGPPAVGSRNASRRPVHRDLFAIEVWRRCSTIAEYACLTNQMFSGMCTRGKSEEGSAGMTHLTSFRQAAAL